MIKHQENRWHPTGLPLCVTSSTALNSKSYSDEPVFVSDKEAKATLKKNIEIMENAFSKLLKIQKKEQDRKQKKR